VPWDNSHRDAFEARIIAEELDAAGVPDMIGNPLGGGAIYRFGSDEQRERHLEPILRGEHIWCQLFSEPDAGSDLASLRTRAERDRDRFVINGQKVWSTWAQYADFGFLLARTDLESERHAGISAFVLPMRLPGIEIRPIREITGTADFCEVFLTDVSVPVDHLIGEEGHGWRIATSSLSDERSSATSTVGSLLDAAREVVQMWRELPVSARWAPSLAEPIARLYERARVLELIGYRNRTRLARGEPRVADAAVEKVLFSELFVDIATLALRVLDARSVRVEGDPQAQGFGRWQDMFLYARAYTIAGGSSEILRSVIGERQLGLPRN
jgi:alkylation response protein AidB-like acyl-CoA dehydrogenase